VTRECEYKGFQISTRAIELPLGGYAASVTLKRHHPRIRESRFDLPLDAERSTKEEALREAMRYGKDLVDGLVPPFDPRSMSA